MPTKTSVPTWFWIIAVLAVIWNALGLMAFIADITQSPEQLAAQPQAIQDLYATRPSWAVAAFALAVGAGLLGSIALLLRKNWAVLVLGISLVAVIVQNLYTFGVAQMHKHLQGAIAFPLMVIVIALALLWFARLSRSKNWLS